MIVPYGLCGGVHPRKSLPVGPELPRVLVLHCPFRMRFREDWVLKYADAPDDIDTLIVQFLDERVRSEDAQLVLRTARDNIRNAGPIRDVSRIIFDVYDHRVQFRPVNERGERGETFTASRRPVREVDALYDGGWVRKRLLRREICDVRVLRRRRCGRCRRRRRLGSSGEFRGVRGLIRGVLGDVRGSLRQYGYRAIRQQQKNGGDHAEDRHTKHHAPPPFYRSKKTRLAPLGRPAFLLLTLNIHFR